MYFYLPGDSVLSMTPSKGAAVIIGCSIVLGALVYFSPNKDVTKQEGLIPESQQPFYEAGMSDEGAETEIPCEFIPGQGVAEYRVICPPVVRIEIIDVRNDNPPIGDPRAYDFRTPDEALPIRNERLMK